MGPTITPIPHTAIAEPCFSGGLISIKTTCAKGTNAAPNTPCSNRAATICANESDIPHNADANVKPAMEVMKIFF